MILFLKGNLDRYEAESFARMLFPKISVSENLPERDFVSIVSEDEHLSVTINLDGRDFKEEKNTPSDSPTREVCRLLLKGFTALTGKTNKWGILTGVRPVKFYRDLIEKNFSHDEIKDIMENKWAVSKENSDFALSIAESQIREIKKLSPRGVSLYVGIPFCPTRCSYCTFVSSATKPESPMIKDYLKAVEPEIEGIGKIIERNSLSLDTVYLGGGTPTILSSEELDYLMSVIYKNLPIKKGMEITCEGGRPDTLNKEKLSVLRSYDVNRISVNPQSMIQTVLDKANRRHSVKNIVDMAYLAMSMGFVVNMDLIAGLAGDSLEGFKYSLDSLRDLNPHNITVHSLTLKRGSRLYEQEDDSIFQKDEEMEKMIEYSRNALFKAGYKPYYLYRNKGTIGNLDNTGYERDNTPCLYNIVMMEEVQSVFSAGAGSVTRLNGDKGLKRIFSLKLPLEYIKHPERIEKNLKEAGDFYENCTAYR